ncbi:hypothetical protein LSAT2_030810, partial [Lamellibrachia satsuma]
IQFLLSCVYIAVAFTILKVGHTKQVDRASSAWWVGLANNTVDVWDRPDPDVASILLFLLEITCGVSCALAAFMASFYRRNASVNVVNEDLSNVVTTDNFDRVQSTTPTGGGARHDYTGAGNNKCTSYVFRPKSPNCAGVNNATDDLQGIYTKKVFHAPNSGQPVTTECDRQHQNDNGVSRDTEEHLAMNDTVDLRLPGFLDRTDDLDYREDEWDATMRSYVAEYLDRVSDAEFELLERALAPQLKREVISEQGQNRSSHGDGECGYCSGTELKASPVQRRERRHSSIPLPIKNPSPKRHLSACDIGIKSGNRARSSSSKQHFLSNGQSQIPRLLSSTTRIYEPAIHPVRSSCQESSTEHDIRPKIPLIIKYFIHRRELTED